MAKKMLRVLVVVLVVILSTMLLASCSGGEGGSGGTDGDTKTVVFSKADEGFSNKVTVTYSGDKVLTVEDVWVETHKSKDDYYQQRVNDMNSAKDLDIKGYEVNVEINDLELKSTIKIDMSKADVKDLYNNWTWWETDKDYLSYDEVYNGFVTESEYTVE